jgi:hypothetical protein
MAMLSTLALPMGMFLIEYSRGSSQLGDYYQVLNMVEQRLEITMKMPFHSIPVGKTEKALIENRSGMNLDLRTAEVGKNQIQFTLETEILPVEFAAMKDSFSGLLQRARVEQGIKRLELTAKWGKKRKHNIKLVAFKANL